MRGGEYETMDDGMIEGLSSDAHNGCKAVKMWRNAYFHKRQWGIDAKAYLPVTLVTGYEATLRFVPS